jgi:DNA polymerase-1
MEKECDLCYLGEHNRNKGREHCITGNGLVTSDIMFVGDFISQNDSVFGTALSGNVGSLLSECIEKAGYKRNNVYATMLVKCNTKGGVNPKITEISACSKLLEKEIEVIKPKVIIALGAIASKYFLGKIKLSDVRGYVFKKDKYSVIPTFAPKASLSVIKNLYAMQSDIKKGFELAEGKYTQIPTKYVFSDDYDRVYNILKKVDEFAFDIETTGLNPYKDDLVTCSFSFKEGVAICLPFNLEYYKKIFSLPAKKITHSKFDCKFLKIRYNIDTVNWFFDTYAAIGLLNDNISYGLKSLASLYTDVSYYNLSTKVAMDKMDQNIVAKYNNADADVTYRLYKLFYKKIIDEGFSKLFFETTMPVNQMLIDIEIEGIPVDINKLKLLNINKNIDLVRIKRKLTGIADINWQSPKQVGDTLFNVLGLRSDKKTPSGGYSTDEKVLKSLKSKHEAPSLLHDARTLVKSLGTYLMKEIKFDINVPDTVSEEDTSKYISMNNEIQLSTLLSDLDSYEPDYSNDLFCMLQSDNKLHNENNLNGTVSGRLASSLHTIPREGGFRDCYVAPEGYKFVGMDYKQFELRIAAYLSKDKKLSKILDAPDAKVQLTKIIAGIDYSEEIWAQVKGVVYGTLYGRGPKSISEEFGISLDYAIKLKKGFFKKFPKASILLKEYSDFALKFGYIEDIAGRTRRFITSKYKIYDIDHDITRQAVNFPIQSGSSAIFWPKVLAVHNFLKDKKSKLIHTKHDAVYFIIHDDEEDLVEKIKLILEKDTVMGDVLVDIKIGKSWGEC